MAIDRDQHLAHITEASLPVRIGRHVMIVLEDGRYRVRRVEIDRGAIVAVDRPRSPSWMPMHHYAAGHPIGAVVIEAETLALLIDALRSMEFPADWG
jgi:hypothetical protein